MGKAATVTSGDCVGLLVTEAHGVHRLASAADDPLQKNMRKYAVSGSALMQQLQAEQHNMRKFFLGMLIIWW